MDDLVSGPFLSLHLLNLVWVLCRVCLLCLSSGTIAARVSEVLRRMRSLGALLPIVLLAGVLDRDVGEVLADAALSRLPTSRSLPSATAIEEREVLREGRGPADFALAVALEISVRGRPVAWLVLGLILGARLMLLVVMTLVELA